MADEGELTASEEEIADENAEILDSEPRISVSYISIMVLIAIFTATYELTLIVSLGIALNSATTAPPDSVLIIWAVIMGLMALLTYTKLSRKYPSSIWVYLFEFSFVSCAVSLNIFLGLSSSAALFLAFQVFPILFEKRVISVMPAPNVM